MPLFESVESLVNPSGPGPVVCIALAAVLGGVIGWQRELHGRAAGLRTHMMLCAGCALVMLTSLYVPLLLVRSGLVDDALRADPARLAASVLTGLGFLGAGVIIVLGRRVIGLTTATGLWVTAAIGLAVGAGYIWPAVFCHVIVVFAMWILKKWERNAGLRDRDILLHVTFESPGAHIDDLIERLSAHAFELREYTVDFVDSRALYKLRISYTHQKSFENVTLDLVSGLKTRPLAIQWLPS